ncbi:MAG: ABC transporter permease, partial [Ferrovibrionaceae bacterium]
LIVAMGMLDVSVNGYLLQTQGAASLGDFAIGIGKSAIFGIIVAVSGCLQGIKAGRSAAAVGQATTTAVVMGILFIIVADGIFAVLFNILGW